MRGKEAGHLEICHVAAAARELADETADNVVSLAEGHLSGTRTSVVMLLLRGQTSTERIKIKKNTPRRETCN